MTKKWYVVNLTNDGLERMRIVEAQRVTERGNTRLDIESVVLQVVSLGAGYFINYGGTKLEYHTIARCLKLREDAGIFNSAILTARSMKYIELVEVSGPEDDTPVKNAKGGGSVGAETPQTLEEIWARITLDRPAWAPASPEALRMSLSRDGIKAVVEGKKGRGNAAKYLWTEIENRLSK